MKYTYRLAAETDGDACAKIVQNWVAEKPWLPPLDDFDRLSAFWRGCLHHVETSWVGLNNDEVVGFCVREDDNLTALYLAAGARSQGVGKALLDLAKHDRDWMTVWALDLNPKARKFYRREGCVEISRDIEDDTNLVDVEHRWTRPK